MRGAILWDIFLHHDGGAFFDAVKSFDVAIELEPDNRIIKNNKAKILCEWASDLYRLDDAAFAIEKIDGALAVFENDESYAIALFVRD